MTEDLVNTFFNSMFVADCSDASGDRRITVAVSESVAEEIHFMRRRFISAVSFQLFMEITMAGSRLEQTFRCSLFLTDIWNQMTQHLRCSMPLMILWKEPNLLIGLSQDSEDLPQ